MVRLSVPISSRARRQGFARKGVTEWPQTPANPLFDSYLGAEPQASSLRPLAACKLRTGRHFRGFGEVSADGGRIGTLGEELCQSFDNG